MGFLIQKDREWGIMQPIKLFQPFINILGNIDALSEQASFDSIA